MADSAQVTVTKGATPVSLLSGLPRDQMGGNSVLLYNAGTVDVLLGGSTVAAGTGFRGLKVGASLGLDVAQDEDVFALSASGVTDAVVDVLKVK